MATDYGRTLGDMIARRGDREAAMHLQRGDAAANLWLGAGNAIGNAVQGWQQSVREREELALRNARDSRQAEADGLQLEAGKLNLAESKRQAKGAETARQVLPLARRPDGVYGYDRDVISREMEAAGHADMLPDVFKNLDEQETSHRNVLNARREAISDDAMRVLRGGAVDDETFNGLLEVWGQNDLAPKKDIDALRKAAKTHGVEQALIAAVSSSEKGQQALAQMQQASQPKPHNVPEGATVIDERTGAVMFQGQPKPPSLTFREGIGPDGKPAVMGFNPQTGEATPTGVTPVPPREPRGESEPLVAIVGQDGQAVLVPRSQAVGAKPASTREVGRQVTSGDAGRIAEFNTALDDVATLGATLEGNDSTGAAAKVGANLPNWATELTGWGTKPKQKQAVIDRVKQVIGKALEGGVLRKEDEAKYEKILPTIGDPPAIVKTKLAGLKEAIELRQTRTIEALEDAGYDTGRFKSRAPSGADVDGWQDVDGIRIREKRP